MLPQQAFPANHFKSEPYIVFGTGRLPYPSTSAWTQNTFNTDIQIWFDYYVKILHIDNIQGLPYMEWATFGVNWPAAPDLSLAELRIQEMNKDSVGHL